jgi:solute carrier family 50 (sugar transporter)
MLIGFPMLGLKEVINKKSTESLPFPLILMGFLVSSAWFVYGIILNSMFVILQNLIAVLLSGFQLSFFVIYPSQSKVGKDKKKN